MNPSYKILSLNRNEDDPFEQMGSKDKFWGWLIDKPCGPWLFKRPRKNTGEHWAEKIAEQIANRLGTRHAQVELSTYSRDKGSASKSFLPVGLKLVHGNQLMDLAIPDYDSFDCDIRQQSNHNSNNIWRTIDYWLRSEVARTKAKNGIAEYLLLDALIANTDRHHENWGFCLQAQTEFDDYNVAPTFDHASSLGREFHSDEGRLKILAEKRLESYVARGHGGIYWSETDRRGPSPLRLFELAVGEYRDLFSTAIEKFENVSREDLIEPVDRIPDDWMSPKAKEFSSALIEFNYERVKKLI